MSGNARRIRTAILACRDELLKNVTALDLITIHPRSSMFLIQFWVHPTHHPTPHPTPHLLPILSISSPFRLPTSSLGSDDLPGAPGPSFRRADPRGTASRGWGHQRGIGGRRGGRRNVPASSGEPHRIHQRDPLAPFDGHLHQKSHSHHLVRGCQWIPKEEPNQPRP